MEETLQVLQAHQCLDVTYQCSLDLSFKKFIVSINIPTRDSILLTSFSWIEGLWRIVPLFTEDLWEKTSPR